MQFEIEVSNGPQPFLIKEQVTFPDIIEDASPASGVASIPQTLSFNLFDRTTIAERRSRRLTGRNSASNDILEQISCHFSCGWLITVKSRSAATKLLTHCFQYFTSLRFPCPSTEAEFTWGWFVVIYLSLLNAITWLGEDGVFGTPKWKTARVRATWKWNKCTATWGSGHAMLHFYEK